ncbi:hypothetical protein H6770_01030 [Candidatus Peribacteria bacterium]|nr:hypothetical protein [Candidatus Peribacteria bacterium]
MTITHRNRYGAIALVVPCPHDTVVENEHPQFAREAEIVARWETHNGCIPVSGQNDLRQLLVEAAADPELKKRIVDLLNPWKATVTELTDEQFETDYKLLQEDNYEQRPYTYQGRRSYFDANHGYYVEHDIDVLR